jgi:protein tyrosine phosphatase (PTP) superfamily phosphohydrolase (DUF442 family)
MNLVLFIATAGLVLQAAPQAPAPATAVAIAKVAIERFLQIDVKLFRGAQPDAGGLQQLQALGVTTVINLRSEEDAAKLDEQRVVESLGMRYVSLPIKDGNFFTRSRIIPDEAVRKFFEAIDAAPGPVFVHCHRGADRTGALVAMYRIARHNWDNQRAYDEARTIGMRSWYTGLKQQILAFRPGPEVAQRQDPGRH